MNLKKLFTSYKKNNSVKDILKANVLIKKEISRHRLTMYGSMSTIMTGFAIFVSPLFTLFLLIPALFFIAAVEDELTKQKKLIYENSQKITNEQIIEIVESDLIKNIKNEIRKAFDSEKIKKCEVYIVAIHAVQQFLIDFAKNTEKKESLFDSSNIQLLKLLNQQKFALQKFIEEYNKNKFFNYDYLEPTPTYTQKEDHFLLLPKRIIIDNYHFLDLDKMGISEEDLNKYNLSKYMDLPALNLPQYVNGSDLIDKVAQSKHEEYLIDNRMFDNINMLIKKIESDYLPSFDASSKFEFQNIKNQRLPDITHLYNRVKNLSDSEYFEDSIKKEITQIETELNDLLQLSRDSLLKEIRVMSHTSKRAHRA